MYCPRRPAGVRKGPRAAMQATTLFGDRYILMVRIPRSIARRRRSDITSLSSSLIRRSRFFCVSMRRLMAQSIFHQKYMHTHTCRSRARVHFPYSRMRASFVFLEHDCLLKLKCAIKHPFCIWKHHLTNKCSLLYACTCNQSRAKIHQLASSQSLEDASGKVDSVQGDLVHRIPSR